MFKMSKLLAGTAAAAAVGFSASAGATDIKGSAYADLRYGLDHFEASGSGGPGSDTYTSMENHGSYWGVKGSATKGGLTAFGGYERWLDADAQVVFDIERQAYAGVITPFGTVQFGTFATAYMDAGRKLDPFYATGTQGVGNTQGSIFGGQNHGQSPLNMDMSAYLLGAGGFVSNQLQYTTPSFAGLTANAAVFFDDTPGENAQDDYAVGAEWSGMGITAGVQYIEANNALNTGLAEDEEATRVYAGFAQKNFGANVSGERVDLVGSLDSDYLQVNGWFGVLDGTRVAASWGMENETGAEGQSFRVGLFHDIMDNFTANVVYRNFNNTVGGPDDQMVSLGASFKFDISGQTTR